MYRYLMSYSRGYIRVRDRVTNEVVVFPVPTYECADKILDKVRKLNYKLRIPKAGKCKVYNINEGVTRNEI